MGMGYPQDKELDITFDEVKQYVRKLPKAAIAGHCASAGSCLIAEALWTKLPGLERTTDDIYVQPDIENSLVTINVYKDDPRSARVHTIQGSEGYKLARLAYAFDSVGNVGDPVPQLVALGIMNAVEELTLAGYL